MSMCDSKCVCDALHLSLTMRKICFSAFPSPTPFFTPFPSPQPNRHDSSDTLKVAAHLKLSVPSWPESRKRFRIWHLPCCVIWPTSIKPLAVNSKLFDLCSQIALDFRLPLIFDLHFNSICPKAHPTRYIHTHSNIYIQFVNHNPNHISLWCCPIDLSQLAVGNLCFLFASIRGNIIFTLCPTMKMSKPQLKVDEKQRLWCCVCWGL